jgi:hypothetical protein
MKKFIGMIAMIAVASLAYGDSVRAWSSYNGAPAYRVKNSGTEKVTITAAAAVVTVTNGSAVTSIPLTSVLTIDELAAAIEAATNASGKVTLDVDAMCALAADTVSNVLVAATITIPANQHTWVNGHKWDSSGVVHFDTYYPSAAKGGIGDSKVVTHLFGDARGTGNITIAGYVDRVQVYNKVFVSPIYVGNIAGSGYTNALTADDVTLGVFDLGIDLPVGQDESILFRATRATTATDFGGMGMILDQKNN